VLKDARGDDRLKATRATEDGKAKRNLHREVVMTNPANVEAWLDLAEACRKRADYEQAIESARNAVQLAPENARAYKELGAALSKRGDWDAAIEALRQAVRLAPEDVGARSTLGGAYRRKGIGDGVSFDWDYLRRARDEYAEAGKLAPDDTYPLLNVAKLDLLLSAEESWRKEDARKQFRELLPLCQTRVARTANDREPYWARFDLADAYLFSGAVVEGLDAYHKAMASVPPEQRASAFSSVASPLESVLRAGVCDGETVRALRTILDELNRP
jgi:tetratricopeptide (TPR) repeat protein